MNKNYPTLKNLLPLFFLLFSFTAFSQTNGNGFGLINNDTYIGVNSVTTPVCVGNSVTVNSNVKNGNNSANEYFKTSTIYTVEISDDNFATVSKITPSATTLISSAYSTLDNGSTNISINATIPSNLTPGANYRIRINSTSPVLKYYSPSSPFKVNALPTTPSTAVTQPTCALATGTITVTTPAGMNYSIDGVNYTNTTGVFNNVAVGTYNVTAKNASGCISLSTPVSIIAPLTATWNVVSGVGTWTNGPPTSKQSIVFAGNYTSAGNIEGCDCTVNAGVKVTVLKDHALKITNTVKVYSAAGASLTFKNRASLVQVNDIVTNTGNIIYERETTPLKKYDYTYWSSPVINQKLIDVSPGTKYDKFYSFNATGNTWIQEDPQGYMGKGIGYIIRAPENIAAPPTPVGSYQASFVGVPFNGRLEFSGIVKGKSYLLGNPYPSALDADKFLMANNLVLTGTLYFWTHKTPIGTNVSNPGSGVYAYSSDDYATYNLTGGIGTNGLPYVQGGTKSPSDSVKPTGKIAAGQAFFTSSRVTATENTIVFNNNMRVDRDDKIMDNDQFFKIKNTSKKTDALERHRFWLNLTNSEGAFKQILVGYITDATNGYDNSFDGESLNGNQFINFYSVNEDKNLSIQGRALPFDENDVVPLGYSSTIQGDFSISIDEVDGLFINQNVIVEDKVLNVTHDLKNGPYKFTTEKGTFDQRFVLRFTNKTLATDSFDLNESSVLISKDKNELKIKSHNETINQIMIFDLLGRKVFDKTGINANEFQISNVKLSNHVIILKVSLTNGKIITKKVLY